MRRLIRLIKLWRAGAKFWDAWNKEMKMRKTKPGFSWLKAAGKGLWGFATGVALYLAPVIQEAFAALLRDEAAVAEIVGRLNLGDSLAASLTGLILMGGRMLLNAWKHSE